MKPYKFQPYLKTTIWDGEQIAPFKGLDNHQPNVGESWEISGVPGQCTESQLSICNFHISIHNA